MNMTRILIFLLIIVSTSLSGQTLEVVYNVQIDMSGNLAQPFHHKYVLINSNGKSIQKQFLPETVSNTLLDKDNKTTKYVKIGNDTTYMYKDFIKKDMFSEENIFTKVFDVKDELNVFKWKIETDTLTILNYKCRKASLTFRGRDYVAYFSEEIPISDGPWKFNGLPGLILKVMIVNSTSVFSMEVSELRITKNAKKIINPYEGKKVMPFIDFKKEYNKKYSELEAYSASQSGGFKVHRGGIELLSDD